MRHPTSTETRSKPHRLFLMVLAVLLACGVVLATKAHAAEPQIGPNYLRLVPVAFSVIGQDNKVDLEVSIALALELKPGVTEAEIEEFGPQIQDQVLVALTDLWEAHPITVNVLTSEIKRKLLPVISGIVGQDKVAQVLILGIGENRDRGT